jgi:type IV pilus assembly protein PilF
MFPKTPIVFLTLSILLTACSTLNQPTDNNIRIADAQITLGLAYLQQGQRVKARSHLLKAAAQAPDYTRLQLAMAYYDEIVGESSKANAYYQKILATHRTHPNVLNNYGAFLCRQGQFSRAQHYFKQAYTQPFYPKIAASYENAGLCALQAKQPRQALRYFLQALNYQPDRFQSLIRIIRLNIKLHHPTSAKTYLTQLVKYFGKSAQTDQLADQIISG